MTVSLPINGFTVVSDFLSLETVNELRELVAPVFAEAPSRGGARDLLRRLPALLPLVVGPLRDLVTPYLGPGTRAVRGLLFDKTPVANWKVTWHQDVTVSVSDYAEVPGWGPWSRKAGRWHVRAPTEVVDTMLTARIHLDACGPRNGPVRVIPGSHHRGRLSEPEIDRAARAAPPIDCVVPEGGVLLLHPLVVHASAPAAEPTHRRVIHIEFAAGPLPDGFRWAEEWLAPKGERA